MVEKAKGSSEQVRDVDPEIDRLWAEEAQDRLTAYGRGELAAKAFREIVAKYRP